MLSISHIVNVIFVSEAEFEYQKLVETVRETIRLAKKKLKPRNVYLRVFANNKIAKSLYRKVGLGLLLNFQTGRCIGENISDTII